MEQTKTELDCQNCGECSECTERLVCEAETRLEDR